MPEALPEAGNEQAEAAANNLIATIANGPALAMNQMYANSNSNQQMVNQMNVPILTRSIDALFTTNPEEGAAGTAMTGMLGKLLDLAPPQRSGVA